jgi:hypothetical protein
MPVAVTLEISSNMGWLIKCKERGERIWVSPESFLADFSASQEKKRMSHTRKKPADFLLLWIPLSFFLLEKFRE